MVLPKDQIGADGGRLKEDPGKAGKALEPAILCQVCHLPLDDGEHAIVKLNCGHTVGKSCAMSGLDPFGLTGTPEAKDPFGLAVVKIPGTKDPFGLTDIPVKCPVCATTPVIDPGAGKVVEPAILCQVCHLPLDDGKHTLVKFNCGHVVGKSCTTSDVWPFGVTDTPVKCPICAKTIIRSAEDEDEGVGLPQRGGLPAETRPFLDLERDVKGPLEGGRRP